MPSTYVYECFGNYLIMELFSCKKYSAWCDTHVNLFCSELTRPSSKTWVRRSTTNTSVPWRPSGWRNPRRSMNKTWSIGPRSCPTPTTLTGVISSFECVDNNMIIIICFYVRQRKGGKLFSICRFVCWFAWRGMLSCILINDTILNFYKRAYVYIFLKQILVIFL